MKQVENIDLTKLHTDEVLGFLLKIAQITDLVRVEADQKFIEAFKVATTSYDEVMRPTTSNNFTEARKAADAKTDRLCVGIRMYTEAQTYNPNPEIPPIAEKVFKTIQKYGYLTSMGYKEKYPNIHTLIADLKAIPAADIETLILGLWITSLEEAYNNFEAISTDKVNEDATKQVGIVQEMRTAAQEAYFAMISRLNAGAEYMGDDAYIAFLDPANVIVNEYKALIASRKTRAANKKNE